MLGGLRARFAALPVAQQWLLGVGVPLAAGAAIVGQVRDRRDPGRVTRPGEPTPAETAGVVLPLPGGSEADVLGAVDALGVRLAAALDNAAQRQAEILERIGDPATRVPAIPETPGPPLVQPPGQGPIATLPVGPPRPVPAPPTPRPPTVPDPARPPRVAPSPAPGSNVFYPFPSPVPRPSRVVRRPDPMTPIREEPARPAPVVRRGSKASPPPTPRPAPAPVVRRGSKASPPPAPVGPVRTLAEARAISRAEWLAELRRRKNDAYARAAMAKERAATTGASGVR